MIGRQVWAQSGDIRDVISISKLIRQDDGHEEIAQIIRSLNKYGCNRVMYYLYQAGKCYRLQYDACPVEGAI
ncbi:MAG: hypothetical protein WAK17_01395 [Candidatus Nitrosopolaris sp.]|jgi:hypothetical protein